MNHPETLPGEVCIGNVYRSDFHRIGWKSRRLGTVHHDAEDGTRIKGSPQVPVFVLRLELEAAGVPIPHTGVIDHNW